MKFWRIKFFSPKTASRSHFFCLWCSFLDFTKGRKSEILKQFFAGKIFFFKNFIFYHWYESINFCSAGLIKIPLIVTPLLIYIFPHLMVSPHFLSYLSRIVYSFYCSLSNFPLVMVLRDRKNERERYLFTIYINMIRKTWKK